MAVQGPDYSGIAKIVRSKLRMAFDDLPDNDPDLDLEIAVLVPVVLVKVPALGADYTAVAGVQKTLLDGAIGRIAAARFRRAYLAAQNDAKGQLIEVDTADIRQRFAGYNASKGIVAVEDTWMTEATEAIQTIVEQLRLARLAQGEVRRSSFVALPGRRRAEMVRSNSRTLDLRDLLMPFGPFLLELD